MREIKIFLASSIVEFANERMAIENFIYRISREFEKRYNVQIQPLLCENFDDAYSVTRKQEEYNEKIRDSELCFFIFFTKAGEYTREEFEVARKKFEETGKPKIYTYFKVIKDGEAEQSLTGFMNELDKVFGHYYGTFDHIDTVKLRILLSLKLQEMDFLEIKAENGNCIVDGKAVMQLDNVSEFMNNGNLEKLHEELQTVEEEYYQLKPIYAKGNCDNEFYRHYSNIASKRQNLIDEIEKLQELIFNVSLQMSYDNVHGEVTVRQKEAYRLFELGDYDGCMAVLDFDEMKAEFLRSQKMYKAGAKKFIQETKSKIDLLATRIDYRERFAEIDKYYKEIIPIIFSGRIEYGVASDYASYLSEQNRSKEAVNVLERLQEAVSHQEAGAEVSVPWVYSLLGRSYSEQNQPKEAEGYYLKAIEMREELAKVNPERFNPDLAESYNNVGVFYKTQGNPKKAEEYYHRAIEIFESLVEVNSERFNPYLAGSCNNAGDFYDDQGKSEKAEGYYLKAIEIYESLVEINPERFNPDLASSYNNAGNFYCKQGDRAKETEEYYLKAIKIYEGLVAVNPERFNPDLASSYNNAGAFYDYQGDQPEKAEEYYLEAIEIREELVKGNPERFNPDLATSYNNAGDFYTKQGESEKAKEYLFKAIEISEELAKVNPERFNLDLANSYNNAGAFYYKQGELKKAEPYCLKAIEIYESLVAVNPERFTLYLASSYNNAGIFYKTQGKPKEAERYFLKAIEIYESLVAVNPERFNPYLAMFYFNYALFSRNYIYFKKALELAKTRPDDPCCKEIIEAVENAV